MASIPAPIAPPERLLCGPGPSNVAPAVLDAMRKPMLGHLDPDLHDILLEVVDLMRETYRARGAGLVLPLQATGMSGMEAGIANLVEPGDTVIVGHAGFFGNRIADMADR
jgi:alanine-glyoxylate transaminase/serine-glyoxylate transaminase/serine-pyruvate transaminase